MRDARRRGFTLIELMVVIVILGMLVAIVGPNVWRHYKEGARKTAEMQISNLRQAIDLYYLSRRHLPVSLQDLTGTDAVGEPWMREVPLDPWGQPYDYRVLDASRRQFSLASAGEDRQMGSADDVTWTSAGASAP